MIEEGESGSSRRNVAWRNGENEDSGRPRRKDARWTRGLASGLLLAWASTAPALAAEPDPLSVPSYEAPVPLRIVAPIHGLFYQFTPTPAAGLAPGRSVVRIELSESNVLQLPAIEPTQVEPHLDVEITRLQLAWVRGITDRWDVGLEIPLLSFHHGWMDHAILEVEEAFDKVKSRRERETHDQFAFDLSRNGRTLFSSRQGGIHLGDVAVTTQYLVERGAGWRPTVALRGALKLPSGDRDRTMGSGVADAAVALSADWRAGRWNLWSTAGLTIPLGEVRDTPGFDTEPIGTLFLEIGYALSPRVRAHLQGAIQSGPFDLDQRFLETGLPVGEDGALTHHIVQMTPALAWRLGPESSSDRTLFVGVVQDFYSSEVSAADATVFAVLRAGF